jgi:hypothetical protein
VTVQSAYGLFFVMPLVVLHYINTAAADAWRRFLPATSLDQTEAARGGYELTVAPARLGWALLVIGYLFNSAWFASDPVGTRIDGASPLFILARVVFEGFITAAFFMLIYQVIRQLRIVGRLHVAATHVDLFRPWPLHAMARLTARSAIGLVVATMVVSLPFPGTDESVWLTTLLIFTAPMFALALVVFFLPLRGLHNRLNVEKAALATAATLRLEAIISATHRLVDDETANEDDLERSKAAQVRIDAFSKAQSSVLQEREVIGKLSTWPWDAGTLRAVVSAIALPILLFLVTRLLERAGI